MTSIADKIMKRIRGHGRGKWVCTPKDFLDLGSRAAVDQALSRLCKNKNVRLRRISRGLYDLPRISGILNRPAPANIDEVVDAVARRSNVKIVPDGIFAANQLGLTNAVPAKASYITNGATKTVNIGSRTIHLRHVSQRLIDWSNRPAACVVQALDWLGSSVADNPDTINILRKRVPDDLKRDLINGKALLPSSWMASIVHKIAPDWSTAV
ncbi:MAG: hypothetical protein RLZZ04_1975 [Cyanobacteriota bacterium]